MSFKIFFFLILSFFHANLQAQAKQPVVQPNNSPVLQPQPEPIVEQPPKKLIGFYEGVVLISFSSGEPMWMGGSLIKREKDQQEALSIKSQFGLTPTRLFYINVPPGLELNGPQFSNQNSFRGAVEYGYTDHIGLGLTVSTLTMDVTHNKEFADPRSINLQAPTFQYNTYLEVLPSKNKFYNDQQYSFTMSYHFLPRMRIDPFLYVDAGIVTFNAYAVKAYQRALFPPTTETGYGLGIRGGAGINLFVAPEFGFQLEFSMQQKWLRSDIIGQSSISSMQVQVGVVYNFERIAKIK